MKQRVKLVNLRLLMLLSKKIAEKAENIERNKRWDLKYSMEVLDNQVLYSKLYNYSSNCKGGDSRF